jgi:hypothetical protein
MATDKDIGFKLEINGVEKSISSIKDLKGAIKDLQDVAENSDIGSEQYKQAIEDLEKLNDQLKEVTQTEKQAAKAAEDLAKAEKEAAKETGDLRKQFEVLEDELFMLAGQGKENTEEFRKLSIEAATLNKRIDAVNQTLGGSSTERAEMGYAKLQESFKKLDFKGISQGFSILKTAIAATGVMLLVQGVTYLYENFDKLSQGSGGLAKALRFVGDIITDILNVGEKMLNWITDTIGLTNQLERDMESMSKAAIDGFTKSKEALAEQTAEMDRNIKVAKAMGKNTVEMEIEKQKAIIETNKQYLLQLEQMAKTRAITEEERKLIKESAKAIKDAKAEIAIIEANDTKDREEKAKAANEKAKAERQKRNDEALKAQQEGADRLWEEWLAEQKREEEYIKQRNERERIELEEADAFQRQVLQEQEDDRFQAWKNAEELREKERAGYAELEKEKYNIALQGLQAGQALSDMYFLFKSKNLKKGSKEEEEMARKAFAVNKALQLSTAVVSGFQAVQGAFATATASPITTVFPAYPFIQAALAGVTSAANIAKIAASKFSSSGGGDMGGGTAPASQPIPAPPTVSNPNANIEGSKFDEQGNKISNGSAMPAIQVNATVGVDEISAKTNRVNVLEKQSTF